MKLHNLLKEKGRWSLVVTVDGEEIPADEYYRGLKQKLQDTAASYNICMNAYKMFGWPCLLSGAQQEHRKLKAIEAKVDENRNLYCIVNSGFSLN